MKKKAIEEAKELEEKAIQEAKELEEELAKEKAIEEVKAEKDFFDGEDYMERFKDLGEEEAKQLFAKFSENLDRLDCDPKLFLQVEDLRFRFEAISKDVNQKAAFRRVAYGAANTLSAIMKSVGFPSDFAIDSVKAKAKAIEEEEEEEEETD